MLELWKFLYVESLILKNQKVTKGKQPTNWLSDL